MSSGSSITPRIGNKKRPVSKENSFFSLHGVADLTQPE